LNNCKDFFLPLGWLLDEKRCAQLKSLPCLLREELSKNWIQVRKGRINQAVTAKNKQQ